jgi:hypothetical protein
MVGEPFRTVSEYSGPPANPSISWLSDRNKRGKEALRALESG